MFVPHRTLAPSLFLQREYLPSFEGFFYSRGKEKDIKKIACFYVVKYPLVANI